MVEAVAFIKRAQFLDTMQLVWPRSLKKQAFIHQRKKKQQQNLNWTNKFRVFFFQMFSRPLNKYRFDDIEEI